MRLTLAVAGIVRRPARTLLSLLGIAVAAAMLLDMIMLSSGMRESFRTLLLSRGFEVRLSPRGTLPFDTEATIADATSIEQALRDNADITGVSPVLGGSLYLSSGVRSVSAIGFGVRIAEQGEYELIRGADPEASGEVVVNGDLLRSLGMEVGDSMTVAVGYDPQLGSYTGERRMRVSGEGRFLYLAREQRAVAMPLADLQRMHGRAREDRVSLFMVRVREGASVEEVRGWVNEHVPTVSATSIATALQSVDERLSYFRQLAYILGSISLVVGFLLITTLVTISVSERTSEIAVMRAIGVRRFRIVQQVVLESLLLTLPGVLVGVALGVVTSRYLNHILSQFPGLPAAIDFFLFQPAAVWRAIVLLMLTGVLAALFPAWQAASLPVAATLRREAVA